MGARTRRTLLAIAVILRKMERKIRFPRRKERRKETQSHEAVLHAVKQEIGQAQEGDQEKRHQEAKAPQ
jgi:hypothetical protein